MNLNFLLAGLCLLGAATLFFVSQGNTASAASCKGAAALANASECKDAMQSRKVSPSPRGIAPNGRGAERSKELCRGGLRSLRGMRDVCEFGAPASRAKMAFALIGDSHAAQWRPALDWLADRQGLRFISLTASSCDFIYGDQFKRSEGAKWRACKRFRNDVPRFLSRSPEISGVLFSSVSQASRSNIEGYRAAWQRLPASVERVGVIRDNPRTDPKAHGCILDALKRNLAPARRCSSPRSQALRADSQLLTARQLGSPGFAALDLSDLFCDPQRCYPVVGGVLVYQDGNHQTPQFNRTLGPYLLRELQAAWPDI